jgi:hypothetical protein
LERKKSINCPPILKDIKGLERKLNKSYSPINCKGETFWKDMNIKIVHSLYKEKKIEGEITKTSIDLIKRIQRRRLARI